MTTFQGAKIWLIELTGLSKDALHIYVGLAVFLLTALIFRLPLRDLRLLGAVFLAAAAGELWDLAETSLRGAPLRWDYGAHDLLNTMALPTVLVLLHRWKGALKG